MTPTTAQPKPLLQCAWCARIRCGSLWLPMPRGLVAGSHGICPQCCAHYFPLAVVAAKGPEVDACA